MIILTKLNDISFVLNDDLIETIEENPDTTIQLTNGHLYIVKETMREVVDQVIEYRRKTLRDLMNPGENGERVD